MLPDSELQLLTAYVDGELSSRQRELVTRLLQKSPEARAIVKDLQEHSRLLQELPKRALGAAFAGQVLDAIQSQPAGRPGIIRRRVPQWLRYAVAASVLVAVLGGSVWLANRFNNQPHKTNGVAKVLPTPPPTIDHIPLAEQLAAGAAEGYLKPVLPERQAPKFPFETLAKTEWQERLVGEMAMQKAVHLDVAVTNQRQAQQRLETVLENKGIRVERDPRAETMLKNEKQQPPTEFVIYAENIRPDELAAMLFELGTDERARTSIESVTVSSVTHDDQQRLCNLLGIQPEELREPPAPKQPQPLGKFIPKDQKDQAGAEPGSIQAPSAGARRLAVVLANEAPAGKLSSQVQYFVNQRRQLQPGALQVIVVVHRA
jgi:hypothetical protein